MSVQAITWAITRHIKPSGAKLLLICLANYVDDKGVCWPSKATLALDCSADKSTVCRWLKILERDGWLSIQERYQNNIQTTSLISLSLPSQERASAQDVPLSHPATQNRYKYYDGSVSPPCDSAVSLCDRGVTVRTKKISDLKWSRADTAPMPGHEKY